MFLVVDSRHAIGQLVELFGGLCQALLGGLLLGGTALKLALCGLALFLQRTEALGRRIAQGPVFLFCRTRRSRGST